MANVAQAPVGERQTVREMDGTIGVFVDTVRWFVRPQNTDWRYTRFTLPRLGEFEPRLRIHAQASIEHALGYNLRFAFSRVFDRLGILNPRRAGGLLGAIDRRELKASNCDLVFSHSGFPLNAEPFPVVWQNSILDPEMQRARGASEADLQTEAEIKRPLFARAAAVQVSTDSEVARLEKMFPELTGRFHSVPFYLPQLMSLSEEEVVTKHSRPSKINLLFVGSEARRKGLDLLLAGYSLLPKSLHERICFDIVSKFSDGKIEIPCDPSIRVRGFLPHEEVLKLMAEAHVLGMPSRFESYGLIFPEAMSKGTVPIVPNWEVQREIVGNGEAGCTTSGEPKELATKLLRLIEDEAFRVSIALAARRRFIARFAPAQVAGDYRRMFKAAINGK